MKKIVKKSCPRCYGKGEFFDKYIKREIPCEKCKRSGYTEEEVDVPREREPGCPVDCVGCPQEHYEECLDKCLWFVPWDEMSNEQKENWARVAIGSCNLALITVDRMRYPKHAFRLDRKLDRIPNGNDTDKDPPLPPEKYNPHIAIMMYSAIGAGYRSGELFTKIGPNSP